MAAGPAAGWRSRRQLRKARVVLSTEPGSCSCRSTARRRWLSGIGSQGSPVGEAGLRCPGLPGHRRAAAVAAGEAGPEGDAERVLELLEGEHRLLQAQLLALVEADRAAQGSPAGPAPGGAGPRAGRRRPSGVTARRTSWLLNDQQPQPSPMVFSSLRDRSRGCPWACRGSSAGRSCRRCRGRRHWCTRPRAGARRRR